MFIRDRHHALSTIVSMIISLCVSVTAGGLVVYGQSDQVTPLELGKPIKRELASDEMHAYSLKLSEGQFFEVCVERLGTGIDARVFSPSKQLVAEGDGTWAKSGCDMVSHIAATGGEYRIEIRQLFAKARPGSYQIKLVQLRPPTEIDRHRAQGNSAFAGAQRRRLRWKNEGQQAIAELREAVTHWQAAEDKIREAMTYASLGTVYRSLGELRQSAEYFEKALTIFRAEGNQLLEVETLTDLSYAYAKQGQITRGISFAREALSLGQARNDQNGQCRALIMLGGISTAIGNVRAGQEYNQQALPFCRAVKIAFAERIALTQIAEGFVAFGEPQQALTYFNQALQIADPAFDAHAQGLIRLNLARLRLQIGELQEALTQAQLALECFRQIGTRDWQANSRLVLGRIYQALGNHEQAINNFTQALELSVTAGDPYLRALSLRDLAGAAIKSGQRADAEKYLQQAADAFREKGAPNSELEALKQLGQLGLIRGTPAMAVDHFKQALALSRKQELAVYETEILWSLGTAYLALGECKNAAESFHQALANAREKRLPDYEIQALGGLARLAQERGDNHEAQAHIETALNLIETSRTRIASPDFRITFFSATRDFYERYIEVLMNQYQQGRGKGDDHFAALALQAVERARARSLLDLLAEAHADIRQGVDPELLNRERELQQRLSAKAERLWLLGQSGKAKEQVTAINAEMDALTLEQQDLAAQIRIQSPRYAALRQPQPLTLPEIQKQVLDSDTLLLEYALGEKRSFLFAVTSNEIRPFVLPGRGEIEQQVKQMLTLLETVGKPQLLNPVKEKRFAERRIQVAASGKHSRFKSVDDPQSWENQLQQKYLEAATGLSRTLLAPVKDLIGKKRLLIVSDGALHYLPFAALPEPVAESSLSAINNRAQNTRRSGSSPRIRPPSRWQPLVVDHEIVTLPSASTLAVLRRELNGREAAPKMVAVLADPVFGKKDQRLSGRINPVSQNSPDDNWQTPEGNALSSGEISEGLFRLVDEDTNNDAAIPRLPGTRREAEAILALVPESQRRVALDFEASRATATSGDLGQYRYLHFATHGLLNSAHPELSGLILSLVDEQGNRQNGILRVMDIYNLKLPVELVVLSACRTALGKESNGEGLMGLTRGFLYAGAGRVVASLWVVNDVATAELMRRFYREMLGEKRLSPPAALRAAQVSMWKEQKWSAPYYWAAFTLQGAW